MIRGSWCCCSRRRLARISTGALSTLGGCGPLSSWNGLDTVQVSPNAKAGYTKSGGIVPVSPCFSSDVLSGLAERALLADSSGRTPAVIEAGRVAASQDTEHAADRCAIGADQAAIALVGR